METAIPVYPCACELVPWRECKNGNYFVGMLQFRPNNCPPPLFIPVVPSPILKPVAHTITRPQVPRSRGWAGSTRHGNNTVGMVGTGTSAS